ncbi:MAG TPA: hypothetical protein VFF27_11760 [Bacteroidia bacterium]|jgi:hypothetical protein|nr:hypothetical protein [Bacteroidia bacterium]
METQDRQTQELIDYLIKHNCLTSEDYRASNNVSQNDWIIIKQVALKRNYMTPGGSPDSYFVTSNGRGYGDNRYIEEIQKERVENELQKQKEEKENQKLHLEVKHLKMQVKVFWLVLIGSGIKEILALFYH